jgi:hypothetical protein
MLEEQVRLALVQIDEQASAMTPERALDYRLHARARRFQVPSGWAASHFYDL